MHPPKRALNLVMVAEDDPSFQLFWVAYPRRVAKQAARRAWTKLNPSPELVKKIVDALAWQSQEWAKDGDWYTPLHPATYLNDARYEDEPKRILAPRQMVSTKVSDPMEAWLRAKAGNA